MLIACVIAYNIIYAVLYHKASVSEVDNLYNEKYHKTIEHWTCKACGNENTSKDLFARSAEKTMEIPKEQMKKPAGSARAVILSMTERICIANSAVSINNSLLIYAVLKMRSPTLRRGIVYCSRGC